MIECLIPSFRRMRELHNIHFYHSRMRMCLRTTRTKSAAKLQKKSDLSKFFYQELVDKLFFIQFNVIFLPLLYFYPSKVGGKSLRTFCSSCLISSLTITSRCLSSSTNFSNLLRLRMRRPIRRRSGHTLRPSVKNFYFSFVYKDRGLLSRPSPCSN